MGLPYLALRWMDVYVDMFWVNLQTCDQVNQAGLNEELNLKCVPEVDKRVRSLRKDSSIDRLDAPLNSTRFDKSVYNVTKFMSTTGISPTTHY
jgi:uncharacterized small protein (DUF1192 family)